MAPVRARRLMFGAFSLYPHVSLVQSCSGAHGGASMTIHKMALRIRTVARNIGILLTTFACIVVAPNTSDSAPTNNVSRGWPTFRGDIRRSGVSGESLGFPLRKLWTHKPSLPPSPAWPLPAKSNLSAKSGELVSPLTFDKAYHVVGCDGLLYYGSSSDDTVYCLDATSGQVQWAFTTEGPVRLAPAVWQGRVYAGSDDGYVYCLDARSGELVWRYRVEGEDKRHPGNGRMISMWPIRGGILVDEGKIYFTAGLFPQQGVYLCSLDADTGSELFKQNMKQPGQGYLLATPSRLFVPIGRTPARAYDRSNGNSLARYGTSDSWKKDLVGGCFALLVDDNLVTGPSEDGHVHLFAAGRAERIVRAVAKRIIVKNETAYLLKRRKLVCYDRSTLFTKNRKPPLKWEIDCPPGSSMIMAGDVIVIGGADRVAAHSTNAGEVVWDSAISGTAEGLAVSDGRLLVSTDAGNIHCFATGPSENADTVVEALPASRDPVDPENGAGSLAGACKALAKTAVESAGVTKGYCLVLGVGTGRLAYEISRISKFRIIGIEEDLKTLERAREMVRGTGMYGNRIVFHHGRLDAMPYAKYVANLIVSESALASGKLPPSREEVLRVLRPCGGTVVLATGGGDSDLKEWGSGLLPEWTVAKAGALRVGKAHRGRLPGAGEWTHFYADPANTACSKDELKFSPMTVQWYGEPGPRQMVGRHRKTVAPLYKNGRLFVSGLDHISAVDAYNGTVLWQLDLPLSVRIHAYLNSGSMVAAENSLYVAAGPECIEFDAQTGKRTRTFSVPADGTAKGEWGYMAVAGDTLFGSVTKPQAIVRSQLDASEEQVCSDSLFALNLRTGEQLWEYAPSTGVIINAAIAIGSGRVYLVESSDPSTSDDKDGRLNLKALVEKGSQIVALDAGDGHGVWRHDADLKALRYAIYLSCSQDTVALTASKTVVIEGKGWMRYDARAFDAASGMQLWQADHVGVNDKTPGDHGNERQHPAIVGNTLYGSNFACDLRTGEMIEGWKWKKSHKCATLSTSANCAFSRFTGAKTPHIFDFSTGTKAALTSITRPGCWINMIPAGGLILVPEASSGCTCPYPVQTSLTLVPED